jgi:DNA-binding Lrp family transcriptional regulator
MSMAPRLVLKQATGWFAAGWTFADAMTSLSDAAFKLFAWLCLNADRHTGRIRITAAEIAQSLGKSESEIQTARDELVERGVCRTMGLEMEIADCYWPYEKQPSLSGPQEYVAHVRKLLSEPACVRCRFTPADEKMARDLYQRGVTLTQVARAIWLGCARKYTTLLSSHAAAMPIASLSYFAAVIAEVVAQSNTSDTYWSYVRRKATALEQEWMSRFPSRTGSAGG